MGVIITIVDRHPRQRERRPERGSGRHPWRTSMGVAIATAGLLLAGSGATAPAEAHTRTQETTNVDSRLTHVPELDGVRWTVHTGGFLVEVEHRGDRPIVIHGYDGEPYLRVGPEGVERNRRSPATYLNDDRFAQQTRRDVMARAPAMPADVDAQAPPEWRSVDSEPRVVWHDHRTHWMSPSPPGFVDVGPLSRTLMALRLVGPVGTAGDDAGVFSGWEIPVSTEHDGRDLMVRGELRWVDPPPAWPWLLLAGLLASSPFPAVRVRRVRERAARVSLGEPGDRDVRPVDAPVDGSGAIGRGAESWLWPPLAMLVLAVATINAIHLVDDLLAWPSDPLDELSGLLHTATFLVAGIAGALWALRMPWGRTLALGVASSAVLYHQGVVHLPMLRASHFPTVWPPGLVRLTVALALAQAVVVLGALIWQHQRRRREVSRSPAPPEPAPAPAAPWS